MAYRKQPYRVAVSMTKPERQMLEDLAHSAGLPSATLARLLLSSAVRRATKEENRQTTIFDLLEDAQNASQSLDEAQAVQTAGKRTKAPSGPENRSQGPKPARSATGRARGSAGSEARK